MKLIHFHSQSLGRLDSRTVLGQIHAVRVEIGLPSLSRSPSLRAMGADPSPDRCCIL